ncbi:MAG: hypothetical protein R6U70_08160, partial [Bacillota bacterium]
FIWNYLGDPAGIPPHEFLYWMPLPSILGAPFAALLSGSFFALQLPFAVLSAFVTTACSPLGATGHSWQITAASGMGIGHKGMLQAAKILALTGWQLLTDPEELKKAKDGFAEDTEDREYVSPIPEGTEPPLHQLEDH